VTSNPEYILSYHMFHNKLHKITKLAHTNPDASCRLPCRNTLDAIKLNGITEKNTNLKETLATNCHQAEERKK